MLFFGHAGLTTGIFYLLGKVRDIKKIDYRFVLIGALLPDIIDKPLGLIILNYGNGRLIAHTLVFALLLTMIALWKKDTPIDAKGVMHMRLYALSGGAWIHLLLDSMWLFPVTLFWPFLGNFQHGNITIYAIGDSITQPMNYLSEAAGLAILLYLVIRNRLYKKPNLMKFIRKGQIN